ncbi:uncharacterized protein LOC120138891 [Hibiscus syriacus]|uniref:uncharacterized protein LOC120138891 n=1 Tax=Hibiscus syriacus TaxID=106335 RepID=UPI001923E906|nr:uncharacterized protein LOC120138891 [Hibiscus syriacus]
MATATPTTVSSDATTTTSFDDPVLSLINKRIRALYDGLRERLNKIMALDYFTTTSEIKVLVEVVVAVAVRTYTTFQVLAQSVPISVPVEVEDSIGQYQQKDGFMQRLKETNGTRLKLDQPKKVEGMQNETEGFLELLPSVCQGKPPDTREADASNYQETETADSQFNAAEELQKNEPELENHPDDTAVQQGGKLLADTDHDQRDVEPREQQSVPRRPCHNQRGCRGTGGGRRGYSNGRGGRGSGRGSGAYQNGRGQYYDQPGNNYYSRSYYNNRGRGGRSSGHAYNNHGLTVKGGPASADVAS